MKKLKLKALEIGAREMLTRENLRNIIGGSGGSGTGACTESCGTTPGNYVSCTSASGDCDRINWPNTIICDGHKYTCP